MSVDICGRPLATKEGVILRGPPGIGFIKTDSGDFNIENKRLCNIGRAVNGEDAVNLNLLLEYETSIEIELKRIEEIVDEKSNKALEEYNHIHKLMKDYQEAFIEALVHLAKLVDIDIRKSKCTLFK